MSFLPVRAAYSRLRETPWTIALGAIVILMLLHSILRLVLFTCFGGHSFNGNVILKILAIGVFMDLFVALVACLPVVVLLTFLPGRWLKAKSCRALLNGLTFTAAAFAMFFAIAVFLFFREF